MVGALWYLEWLVVMFDGGCEWRLRTIELIVAAVMEAVVMNGYRSGLQR